MFVKRKKRLFVLLKDAVSSGRFEIVKDNYRFVADIETEVDREDRKPRMSIDFNNGTAEIRLVNVSDPRGLGRKVADALYRYFRGDMGIIDLLKKVYEAYEDEAHRQGWGEWWVNFSVSTDIDDYSNGVSMDFYLK